MAPLLRARREPVAVEISPSSSSGDTEEEEDDEEESEWSDDSSSEEGSCCSVIEIDDEDGDDEDDDELEVDDDQEEEKGCGSQKIFTEEHVYDRIVDLLRRGKDLDKLKLQECKVYLRKHGLRISGNKAVCMQRIHEHWRIKDGNAESLYPESSFAINCTGDVCKGDIILFKQRVYEKFDIVTRGANVIGKRTIAGRVVKESYGSAKQQHTFTVEVLWSRGVKRLPALCPLLVKGRNLYRLRTFRQRWANEAQRRIVLSEKHKRGSKARHTRAISKARSTNKGSKHKIKASSISTNKGACRAPRTNKNSNRNASNKQSDYRVANPYRAPERAPTYTKPIHPPKDYPGQGSFHPSRQRGPVDPHHARHALAWQNHLTAYHPSSSQPVPSTVPSRGGFHRVPFPDSQRQFSLAFAACGQNAAGFHQESVGSSEWRPSKRGRDFIHTCPSPGCHENAARECVVASCYSCCRRIRRRCYFHQN